MIPKLMCDGNPNSKICIIGMAPGRQELLEGMPFIGPSGDLLWSMASRAGFTRADAYILNTIAEYPDSDKEIPSPEQLDRFWDFFDSALSQFTGKAVLVLGADAMERTIGFRGVTSWRGYLLPEPYWGTPIRQRHILEYYKTTTRFHKKGDPKPTRLKIATKCPVPSHATVISTFHPSSVMRTGFINVPPFAYDVARAWRVATDQIVPLDFSYGEVATNLTSDHSHIVVDIETGNTLGLLQSFITRIGLGNDQGTWTVPWSATALENAQRELGGSYERTVVGHNLCFDIPRLERAGVEVKGPLFDTMLACQILQPDIFKGLNGAASMYLDVERWKHLNEDEPAKYNAYDVLATHYLYKVLKRELENRGLYKHFTTVVMPALRTLMALETNGLKVDLRATQDWLTRVREEIASIKSEFNSHYPDVSIASPKQLTTLVYTTLGMKSPAKRDTSEPTIKRFARNFPDIPAFSLILKYRELTSYEKKLEALQPDHNGCIHPSYAPSTKDDEFTSRGDGESTEFRKGMAASGRIQAKNPNPQQLNKDARTVFIPHNPNNIFVEYDYDAAELRICAWLSGDKALLAATSSADLHAEHAAAWGCSRDIAKTLLYATLYGASPFKLQMVYTIAGISLPAYRCKELQENLFLRYPDYKAWRLEIQQRMKKERKLVNPFGRVRYFWHPQKDIPAALDFLPQSTVADIVWSVLPQVATAAEGLGGALRTIVHDSFLFEFPPSTNTEPIKAILEQQFNNVAPGFYLPTHVKQGPNWGSLKGVQSNGLQDKAEDETEA